MKKFLSIRNVILVVLIGGGLIQLIRIDKTNPPVQQGHDFIQATNAPAEVTQILNDACYDCHSNATVYPWYSNIAPVSWWLKDHIDEGREELNFSEWTDMPAERKSKKMKRAIHEVKEGDMPLSSYTWAHSKAKLTDAQKKVLADFFQHVMEGKASAAPVLD